MQNANYLQLKYISGGMIFLPLLPFLYFQGKNVRKKVPKLPDAKKPFGKITIGAQDTKTIWFLGESTMAGVGVEFHKEGFAGSFSDHISHATHCNVDWKVFARSGSTVSSYSSRMINQLPTDKPDLLVCALGGNDGFALNSPLKWKSGIKLFIDQIRRRYRKVPLVFCGMPPIRDFPAFPSLMRIVIGKIIDWNGNILAEIAQSDACVYYQDEPISLAKWAERYQLSSNESLYFSDGVHPSAFTYQLWGKEMAKQVLEWKLI